MKNKLAMVAIGLSLKVNQSKDGKEYYQVSIDQEGEAGSLPLSEEAYKNNKDTFKKYIPYSFTCEYNDQYKTLRVVSMNPTR